MKQQKNANQFTNRSQGFSLVDCMWSITQFLPSLQLLFIFGMLLSAEGQAFGQNKQKHSGHMASSQRAPYDQLLFLSETYSHPNDFNEMNRLLEQEGTYSNLIRYSAYKQNPLTIAQRTENAEAAKIILDARKTFYCTAEQQAHLDYETPESQKGKIFISTKETSTSKLQIAHSMLQAGCKLVPGPKKDHHKYINGLSLIALITSVATNDYIPIGSNTPLSETVFTAFLDQLNNNDLNDRKLIFEAIQIALYYDSENNPRSLDLLTMRYSDFLMHYDPRQPSGSFYSLIKTALNYKLKTVNFLLRFITTREQLEAYINLATGESNQRLLALLNAIKAHINKSIDENHPEDFNSEAVKTVVYRRKRHEHFMAKGNLVKLRQELLIFDSIFGKYPGCDRYVVMEKVVAGQLDEAAVIMIRLLNSSESKKEKNENQEFLNFIEWIRKPHQITIKGFQPPPLDALDTRILLDGVRAPNSLSLSKNARDAATILLNISEKHKNLLLKKLRVNKLKNAEPGRKERHHAILEEIKRIDNHLLYFLQPVLAYALIEFMLITKNTSESFQYFKLAISLEPSISEQMLFDTEYFNHKDDPILPYETEYREKVMIFISQFPEEMYGFIKRKLTDYMHPIQYNSRDALPNGLHDILVQAKEIIRVYYARPLPPAVIFQTPNIEHLKALLITLTESENHPVDSEEMDLGEEVIVSEIKALQKHNLLGREFKLGNIIFTLEKLQNKFAKLRPFNLSDLFDGYSWRSPTTIMSFVVGILSYVIYRCVSAAKLRAVNPLQHSTDSAAIATNLLSTNNTAQQNLGENSIAHFVYFILFPLLMLLRQGIFLYRGVQELLWGAYYVTRPVIVALMRGLWSRRWSLSELATSSESLQETLSFHYALHVGIKQRTGLITSFSIDTDMNVISNMELPAHLSTETLKIWRADERFVPSLITFNESNKPLVLQLAQTINEKFFPLHTASFACSVQDNGLLRLTMCSRLNLSPNLVNAYLPGLKRLRSIDMEIQERLVIQSAETLAHDEKAQAESMRIEREALEERQRRTRERLAKEKEEKEEKARELAKERSKADCIEKITRAHTKAIAYQPKIEIHLSVQRQKDYETLKTKIAVELSSSDLARSARRTTLRDALALVDELIPLSKQPKPEKCSELPVLSNLTLPELMKLQKQHSTTEQTLTAIWKKMDNLYEELDKKIAVLKTLFKNDGKKFEFVWGTDTSANVSATSTASGKTTHSEISSNSTTNIDDDGDAYDPDNQSIQSDNDESDDDPDDQSTRSCLDDDNDSHSVNTEPQNITSTNEFMNTAAAIDELGGLISAEEIRLQKEIARLYRPGMWLPKTKVISQSSASATSSSVDTATTKPLSEHHQQLIDTADQLCNEIASVVEPLKHENGVGVIRRKCIYQLIDLFARFQLALINIHKVGLFPREDLIEDVISVRNALRHNATYFLHSPCDNNLNREIYNFGLSLSKLLQTALSKQYKQPKNSLLGILAHNETESKLSAEQLAIALHGEFVFLQQQLSKPDVTLASLVSIEQRPYFYAGFLTQIGNLMHEFHHRFPAQDNVLMPNETYAKIQDGTATELSFTELGNLSTGNLLYLCWEVRNIRGHNLNITTPDSAFIYDLMRTVANKGDEFITQLEEFMQTLAEPPSPGMTH